MIGLALGALNFGTQAFGALSAYNDSQAAARRQNAYNKKIYNLQIRQRRIAYAQQSADYKNRKIQFGEQVLNNQNAAQRAYMAEQSRMNELYKQMGFAEQAAQIGESAAMGKVQAREVSGRSMQRMSTMVGAAAGRNQAIRQEQFNTALQVAEQRNTRTREQLKIANRNAWWNVGQPPVQTELPPPPLAVQGQSQGSLIAGLGQAALGGFNAFMNYANYDPQG